MISEKLLYPYTVIDINGKEYIITKATSANYFLMDMDGGNFKIPVRSYGVKVVRDYDPELYKSLILKTTSEFKIGGRVVFVGSKFQGLEGLVAKFNERTVSVLVEDRGIINTPPKLIKAVVKNG